MTWALILLNLAVLSYTSTSGVRAQRELEDVMRNSFFLRSQGRIYAQFIDENPAADYPPIIRDLASQVRAGQTERFEVLGQLAFRDIAFLQDSDVMDFKADPVALNLWKKKIARVKALQDLHPSFTFGLNGEDLGLKRWVSYIFVHSGAMHFLGNMLFLAIFGSMLEMQIGGLGLLVSFLLSGVMGAGAFASMTGMTTSPLVGASGAVSGVMVLYCVLNWTRPARFFYWLFLPFRGFMGFVYLPTWVALAFWAINDFAGYVGTLPELGGVAHAAHLGGEFAGLLIGMILIGMRRYRPVSEPVVEMMPKSVAVGQLLPFLPARPPKIKTPA